MNLRNKKTGEIGYYLHTHRDHKTGALKVAVLKDGVPFSEFKPHEPIYDYDSLSELNEDWEDYSPKEPLIKDEKIRKAVRAWAEANGYGKDEVYEFEDFSTGWKSWSLEHKVNGDDNEIHFNGGIDFDKVEHQGYYTIDELCGEEEDA